MKKEFIKELVKKEIKYLTNRHYNYLLVYLLGICSGIFLTIIYLLVR